MEEEEEEGSLKRSRAEQRCDRQAGYHAGRSAVSSRQADRHSHEEDAEAGSRGREGLEDSGASGRSAHSLYSPSAWRVNGTEHILACLAS